MTVRVLDASVVATLIFEHQRDLRSLMLIDDVIDPVFAPPLLGYEIANAAHQLALRGRLGRADALESVRAFAALPIQIVHDPRWVSRSFEIATEFGQRATYDAIYLACAEDVGAELWTRDRRFVESFGDRRPRALRLFPDDMG